MQSGSVSGGNVPCEVEYDQYFVGTKAQLLSAVAGPDRSLSEFLAANYQCRHIGGRPTGR